VQRALDLTGRVKLSSVAAITVTAVPIAGAGRGVDSEGTGVPGPSLPSLVRVEADLANLRPVVAAGAAVPTGLAWAGGAGLAVGRSWYRRQHRQVAELLGWLLDQVGPS
jgi:hypothetical protein